MIHLVSSVLNVIKIPYIEKEFNYQKNKCFSFDYFSYSYFYSAFGTFFVLDLLENFPIKQEIHFGE